MLKSVKDSQKNKCRSLLRKSSTYWFADPKLPLKRGDLLELGC
jgi:hypothetical protein